MIFCMGSTVLFVLNRDNPLHPLDSESHLQQAEVWVRHAGQDWHRSGPLGMEERAQHKRPNKLSDPNTALASGCTIHALAPPVSTHHHFLAMPVPKPKPQTAVPGDALEVSQLSAHPAPHSASTHLTAPCQALAPHRQVHSNAADRDMSQPAFCVHARLTIPCSTHVLCPKSHSPSATTKSFI